MSAAPATVGRERARVLVVDDDAGLRLTLRAALEQGGFEVEDAPDGLEALAAFDRREPDIVLLDILMPGIDGYETCRRLRERPGGERCAVVTLTGLDDTESIRRAYEAGATDFLTKPINYLLLSQRLAYLLRSKRTADALRRSESRLRNAQRVARLGHWEWRPGPGTAHRSELVGELLGPAATSPAQDLAGWVARVHPEDRSRVEEALREALEHGRPYTLEHRVRPPGTEERFVYQEGRFERDAGGALAGAIGTVQDVTARRRAERRARWLSRHDPLTGLPNRRVLLEHLDRAIARAGARGATVAVICVDIDGLRRFNETLGHEIGDAVLAAVATRLTATVRATDAGGDDRDARLGSGEGDAVGRIGGDEFALVVTDVADLDRLTALARRVRDTLAKPFSAEGETLHLGTRLGVGRWPNDAADAATLLERAETAMHHAAATGAGCHYYEARLDEAARRRFEIERALHEAVPRGDVTVHYQPRIALRGERLAGVEALARWTHPTLGPVPPAEFIPVAERAGLIAALGEAVIVRAASDLARWRSLGIDVPLVSVNLSAAQFREARFATTARELVVGQGADPRAIELELTEGLLIEDGDAALATLRRLRDDGFRVAVDDFGTGYCSLSYLKRFPLDTLKIDGSFVEHLPGSRADAAIVTATIALALALDLTTVAERVEQPAQVSFLRERGCDEVQGFLLSRPLERAALERWIAAGRPLPADPAGATAPVRP